MKKSILMFVLALLLYNCNKDQTKKGPDDGARTERDTICIDTVCNDSVRRSAEGKHKLDSIHFDAIALNHLENKTPAGKIYYHYKWADLEQFICDNNIVCYNHYIMFYFRDKKIVPAKADFYENGCTYSVPFFQGIKLEHSKPGVEPVTISFTKGIKITANPPGADVARNCIIFRVKFSDKSVYYYDMSDDPADG